MATQTETVNVVINAKDNASATIKRVVGTIASFLSLRAVIGFLKDAGEAAAEEERAHARLAAALRNSSGATNEQIQSLITYAHTLQNATGFSDEMIVSASAMLGTFKLNTEQITELIPRLLDMAAAMESSTGQTQDLESIATAVGKAVSGSGLILTRYGVVLTEAQKRTIEMGNAEQRLAAVTQALDDSFKGMAATVANTVSGRLKIFAQQWDNVKEAIGAGLNPALSALIDYMTGSGDAMEQAGREGIFFFKIFATGAEIIGGASFALQKLGNWITQTILGLRAFGYWMIYNSEKMTEMGTQSLILSEESGKLDLKFGNLLTTLDDLGRNIEQGKEAWWDYSAGTRNAARAAEEVSEKAQAAADKIADLNRQLSDAMEDEKTRQIHVAKDIGERIVEQDKRVKDAQERLAEALTDSQSIEGQKRISEARANLQLELDGQKLAAETSKQFAAEVEEARKIAAMNDFERFIYLSNQKEIEEGSAYMKRVARIMEEIEKTKEKNAAIISSEKAKAETVIGLNQRITTEAKSELDKQENDVRGFVDRVQSLYQRLMSLRTAAPSLFFGAGMSMAASTPSGAPITLNVSGNQFLDQRSSELFADKLMGILKNDLRIGK